TPSVAVELRPARLAVPDRTPPATSPLSLHDALPISASSPTAEFPPATPSSSRTTPSRKSGPMDTVMCRVWQFTHKPASCGKRKRSEEHTSELQSREKLVCRLLLEKKKTTHANNKPLI